jgi:hypothetical protein
MMVQQVRNKLLDRQEEQNMATDFEQQEPKKKAWTLAMQYFKKCTKNGAFKNNKPTSEFFKVRSFFMQIDENSMLKLHKYMNSLEYKEMSLTDLFIKANELNAVQFAKANTNKTVRERKQFDINKWLDDNA